LCEEFGFEEFSAKLSQFSEFSNCSERRQFESLFAGLRSVSLKESIEFHVNGIVIEIEIAEAAALFRSVREQLSIDGCGRRFFVNLSGIEASDIRSLELVLSGESISIGGSEALLSSFLGNADLERLFLGCWKSNTRMNLSELLKERLFDFESVDISVLSIEALDNLLLNEIVRVESEDALLRMILKLGSDYRDLVRHIKLEFLSEDGLSLLSEELEIPPESVWECAAERISHPPPLAFNSLIMLDIPEILADFQGKRFSLLWRGSRDGFGASEFHGRCDGHANTLTVILDTNGNIFGGFTPVKWESRVWNRKYGDQDNRPKADDSLKSFVFTLKNPHNIPARRFRLKAEKKNQAICCSSDRGPWFYGLCICDNCNSNSANGVSGWEVVYTNDTGWNGGDGFRRFELFPSRRN
jgi:hypothetical protein